MTFGQYLPKFIRNIFDELLNTKNHLILILITIMTFIKSTVVIWSVIIPYKLALAIDNKLINLGKIEQNDVILKISIFIFLTYIIGVLIICSIDFIFDKIYNALRCKLIKVIDGNDNSHLKTIKDTCNTKLVSGIAIIFLIQTAVDQLKSRVKRM